MKPEIQNELDEVVDRIIFYLEDHILNTIAWQMEGNTIICDCEGDEWMDRRQYVYNKVTKQL
jgi:hypothetical protein